MRLADARCLIGEIDGREWHDTPVALLEDRRRQNAIVRSGVADILRFTAQDLRVPGAVGSTVLRYLRRTSGYQHHRAE